MNWKNLTLATLFAASTFGALSAQAQDNVKAETYMYGTHLDINKVLSTEDSASPVEGLLNTRLTYLDSHGQKRILDYRTVDQSVGRDS